EITEAKSSQFGNIHFDFDKYTIREDAKPSLKAVADWLIKNKDAKMILEGHCDERGTNEYNLALGEKRAKAARDYIVSAGVTKNRLDTISYGEEKPLCKEQTEDCWQKNRRVQFVNQTSSGKAGK
ncbi:MAG: peptidoglycan-associated lipoprotein Pal, partial [Nitrospirae bacterium]|nr:peptidoglycan-associated lipoprotein Pal [Nitrospirota bacterium]